MDGRHNPLEGQDAKNSIAAYLACVTSMDEKVGQLVEKVKELGLYHRTIFVYTSDHGETLYEHGLRGKHCMFEASVACTGYFVHL